jgi:hypothetical protein
LARLTAVPSLSQVGRRSIAGDLVGYDGEGKLLFYIKSYFSLFIRLQDTFRLCDQVWQPYGVSLPIEAQVLKALPALKRSWTLADNDLATSWLVNRLHTSGLLERNPEALLNVELLKAIEGVEGSVTALDLLSIGDAALRLDLEAVVEGLLAKLGASESGAKGFTEEQEEALGRLRPMALLEMQETNALCRFVGELVTAEQAAMAKEDQATLGSDLLNKGEPSVVVRVLEIAEADVITVVERLSHLRDAVGPDVVIEWFLGSHNAALLGRLGRRLSREPPAGLRFRQLLLPADGAPVAELKDTTFQAMIVDDWTRSGAATFALENSDKGSAAHEVMRVFSPLLVPGARVLVRGLVPEPLWLRIVSQASSAPMTLASSDSVDVTAQWRDALEVHRGQLVSQEIGDAGAPTVLQGATSSGMCPQPGLYVVVASSEEQGRVVASEMLDAAPGAEVKVLVVHEDSSAEDVKEVLIRLLTVRPSRSEGVNKTVETCLKINNLDIATVATEDEFCSIDSDVSMDSDEPTPPEEGEQSQPRLRAMVFAAGLEDATPTGQAGFMRLVRLSQALLLAMTEIRKAWGPDHKEGPPLWVLSEGVYGGLIRPNQGTLQGLTNVLSSELNEMVPKLVDLGDAATDLAQAIALVAGGAREKAYSVVGGRVRVSRFRSLDRDRIRTAVLKPSGPAAFIASPHKDHCRGMTFEAKQPGQVHAFLIQRELSPPGPGEVLVDVKAPGLNFRVSSPRPCSTPVCGGRD